MKHGHVRLAAALDVVPVHGRVPRGRDGHAQPREGGPSSPDDVGEVDHEGGHPVADDVAVVRVVGQVVRLLVDEDGVLVDVVVSAETVVSDLDAGNRINTNILY